MPFVYNNWYWYVGADRTKVYSSASASYVVITDTKFVAWLAADKTHYPTPIPTEAALFEVLGINYPQGTPTGQTAQLLQGAINITCTSVPVLNGSYAIDDTSRSTITSIAAAINANLGLPGGGNTFEYADITGNAHAWPASQFIELAKAIMNYIYQVNLVVAGASTSIPSPNITIS
jgi:hypothetical protein